MSQVFPARPGQASIAINGPLTGFGELQSAVPTPSSQVDFVQGIVNATTTTRAFGTGASVTSAVGEVILSCGTQSDGYARAFANRVVNYRPGQGTLVRGTARFAAGIANNTQSFGAYNAEAGYRFGYSGTTFGIIHTETGTREILALTVTVAPSSGGNVTITLDGGTPVTAAVTTSGSTSICASEIAAANYGVASRGWDATALANVVYFVRRQSGPSSSGAVFNAGATGVTAAFAVTTTGVNATNTFISQANWNQDAMDGKGPSRMLLDPTKGNIYQIQFQYLGYGAALFGVENAATGRFVPVHIIQNANKRSSTVLRVPSCYVTWENTNSGNTTQTTMYGASGMSAVEGEQRYLGPQRAYLSTRTISAGVDTPVLTLRAARVYRSRASTGQVILNRFSVACDGTKTVDFKVYKNATLTAATWASVDASNSIVDVSTTATAATGGTLVYAFSAGKTTNLTDDVRNLEIFLQSGDTLTIMALSVNNSDISVSAIWNED